MLVASLSGIPAFLAYAAIGTVLTLLFLLAYTRVTAHDELKLVRQGNEAATIAAGSSLLGFALPLASAMAHSVSLLDCAIWGVVALLVQLLAYGAVRLTLPDLTGRIERGERTAGIWAASVSLTAGTINAAAMTS